MHRVGYPKGDAIMSRKHFQALAECLREAKVQCMLDMDQWEYMIRVVANVCSDDNQLFDRTRFYSACRVDRNGCETCGHADKVQGLRFCDKCQKELSAMVQGAT